MKYFVFSDVHGDCNALLRAVKKYGYQPENSNHTLISCGDNFGRADTGYGSKGIFDYLTSPVHQNPPICLVGNHELILKEILFRRSISVLDIQNGEHKTVYSFLGRNQEDREITSYEIDELSHSELMNWLINRPYYFETNNFIFLHGFLPFDWNNLQFITDNFEQVDADVWKYACWSQTPEMIKKFAIDYPNGLNKTIVFGHWHNERLREAFEPVIDYKNRHNIWRNERLKLIGLDSCMVSTHRLNMLVVED